MLPVGSTNGSRERVPTLARSGASTTHTSNKGRISAVGQSLPGRASSKSGQVRYAPKAELSSGADQELLARTASRSCGRIPSYLTTRGSAVGQGAVQGSFRVAKARPKFPGEPARHPATSTSRFLDQEANETHRRLFGRRDSNPVGGHQQRAALLQMLKRSQGSNIQHRELVPIHPQKERNILRGQPRKKNFASTCLFPLGDL